ncbi:outer membrane beta-barrel protein [Sphingobacterium sp.]|uniref:outer membrane beta-barrel protein n=1 Tax=Sphingobacterium sp. TaxID=341027 RepID=UPI0031DE1065
MCFFKKWCVNFSLLLSCALAHAQERDTFHQYNLPKKNFLSENLDYRIQAHFSLGGSSPLGLPQEIREIKSYNPTLQVGLEANATLWPKRESKIGLRLGIAVEGKGMRTNARVKNYLTGIIQDHSEVTGYFTGEVETFVSNTYVTVPILAIYHLNENWNFYGGMYVSAAIAKTFNGYVSNGYLRQNTPVGTKISFENENRANYDFSDEIRTMQWGARIGSERFLNNNFVLMSDLTYGFNGILEKDFHSISFNLHNIYMNIGFGYRF